MNDYSEELADKVEYRFDATPKITSISPYFGDAAGGYVLTIKGERFPTNIGSFWIDMDGPA